MTIENTNYIVIDIETVPIRLDEQYFELSEKEKLSMLNPIESKIIAIGLGHNDKIKIYHGDEKVLLLKFWSELEQRENIKIVGFNVLNFDLPFIVSRSLINDIKIKPLTLKNDVIDIRDNINCFKYGQVRGRLKEYAKLLNIETLDIQGDCVAKLVYDNNMTDLIEYLKKDIEITNIIYKKCCELNIDKIKRW